jgi:hypothetical protein
MTTSIDQTPPRHAAVEGLVVVFAIALLYSFVHIGFRLLASSVLGEDDTLDTILSQDLRIAYDAFPRQPPLYNWVLWAVQQVIGPRIEGFLLIKYAALTATAGFLYSTAFRATGDRLWSMLTVESLALIYQISWRFHEGFTHEVGAMVAVAAATWALLRASDLARVRDFAVLGITCGLGLLTEPAFTVYLLSLLIAASLQPCLRSRIFRAPLLLSLLIALAVASPYLLWLLADGKRLAALAVPAANHWQEAMKGLSDALRGPFFYLAPLILFLPAIFPRFAFVVWNDLRTPPNATAKPDYEQLVMHAGLVAFALSIVGALAFAIKDQATHVLMPLYVMSVVWLFGAARRACDAPIRIDRFARLAIFIALLALVVRLINMFVLDPACRICRWGIPYASLAREMRAHGFDNGTIVSIGDELPGNLRQLFPASKVVTRGRPDYTPEGARLDQGKRAYVWPAGTPDARIAELLGPTGLPQSAIPTAIRLDMPWRHIWYPTGYRTTSWKLVVLTR